MRSSKWLVFIRPSLAGFDRPLTEVLKSAVRGAVNTFLKYDLKLLDDEIHEQSISHRIAVYLEDYFGIRKRHAGDLLDRAIMGGL